MPLGILLIRKDVHEIVFCRQISSIVAKFIWIASMYMWEKKKEDRRGKTGFSRALYVLLADSLLLSSNVVADVLR